jgi:hypothetical protein
MVMLYRAPGTDACRAHCTAVRWNTLIEMAVMTRATSAMTPRLNAAVVVESLIPQMSWRVISAPMSNEQVDGYVVALEKAMGRRTSSRSACRSNLRPSPTAVRPRCGTR